MNVQTINEICKGLEEKLQDIATSNPQPTEDWIIAVTIAFCNVLVAFAVAGFGRENALNVISKSINKAISRLNK